METLNKAFQHFYINIFKSAQREHFYLETYNSATTYFQKVRKAVSKLLEESIVEITIQQIRVWRAFHFDHSSIQKDSRSLDPTMLFFFFVTFHALNSTFSSFPFNKMKLRLLKFSLIIFQRSFLQKGYCKYNILYVPTVLKLCLRNVPAPKTVLLIISPNVILTSGW